MSSIFGHFYDGLPGDQSLRQAENREGDEYEHPLGRHPGRRVAEAETVRRSYPWLALLLLLCLGRLMVSLVHLQLQEAGQGVAEATANRARPIPILPRRGVFLDSDGKPLLTNKPSFSLAVTTADFPIKAADRAARYQQIEQLAGLPGDTFVDLEKRWVFSLEPRIIKDNVDRDEALLLSEKLSQVPGVQVVVSSERQYDSLPGLSHILGYVGRLSAAEEASHPGYQTDEVIGKTGLERQYESAVRGQNGEEEVEINARGQIQRVIGSTNPVAGDNVQLYLDRGLQTELTNALRTAIQNSGAKAAVGIALDPNTGGILASVSLPDYDANLFSGGISSADYAKLTNDPTTPLLNRVLLGQYPSGSTIKPFIGAAALAEHVIPVDKRIQTPEIIQVGQSVFRDWKAHGSADLRQAIAESNNVYFYSIGGGWNGIPGLGIDRIADYLKRFGFGGDTKVDWPGEAPGNIPTPAGKKQQKGESWYIGDTYNTAIGQGDLLVTPLQMARGIATIANGGKLIEPRFAKALTTPGGKTQPIEPRVDNPQVVPADVIQIIQEAMRQTVTSGTARPLQQVGVPVAAKTGTAQFTAVDKDKSHAWTVAYAPADHPQIVLVVVIEGGGESFDVAVPVVKDVLSWKWPPS